MSLARTFGSGPLVRACSRHYSRWWLILFRLPIRRCIVVIVELILSTLRPVTGVAITGSWVKVYTRLAWSPSRSRIPILAVAARWSCQGAWVWSASASNTISSIRRNIGASSGSCLRAWTLIQCGKYAFIRSWHSFTFANNIKSFDLLCQIIFKLIDFHSHLFLILPHDGNCIFIPFELFLLFSNISLESLPLFF